MSEPFDLAAEFAGMSDEQLGFALIPVGKDYEFIVVAAHDREARSGNPQISMTVEFTNSKYEGEQEFVDITFSRKSRRAIQFFNEQISALGVGTGEIQNLKTFDRIAAYIVGSRFIGEITHQEFPTGSGKKKLQIMPRKFLGNTNHPNGGLGSQTLEPFKGNDATPAPVGDPSGATSLAAYAPAEDEDEAPAEAAKVPETVPASAPAEATGEDPWT